MRLEKILPREERKGKKKILAGEPPAILLGWPFLFSPLLASLHFSEKTRRSGHSQPHRRAGAAPRFAKSRGGGFSRGSGGGDRPSAPLCGNPFGFADASQDPGRFFPESRRPPPRQSKLSPQKHMPKVKGGKLSFGFDFPPGSF
jgi:hypothetical protein